MKVGTIDGASISLADRLAKILIGQRGSPAGRSMTIDNGVIIPQNPYQPKPEKADKGKPNGSCNRRACQRPGATWFNRGTQSYYCTDCAHMLNRDNPDTAEAGIVGLLCIPMAEQHKL